jgi:hypothetical protein
VTFLLYMLGRISKERDLSDRDPFAEQMEMEKLIF